MTGAGGKAGASEHPGIIPRKADPWVLFLSNAIPDCNQESPRKTLWQLVQLPYRFFVASSSLSGFFAFTAS
jgi:hypothetical protein